MTSDPVPASAHPGVEAANAGVQRQYPGDPPNQFPDFSEFQGAVDWNALGAAFAAGQLDAVAIRAGFGTVRADAQFATNQSQARARGIPVIYYWFNYPAYNTPAAEAAMFNATVGPVQPGEAMCGDFEDDPNANPFPRGAAGLQWARDFLSGLQTPVSATWWYTYPFLLSDVGLQPLFATWPLWMADYTATPDSAFAPAIARQFTDCGNTPGIGGCTDQSRVLRPPLTQWLIPAGPGPGQPRPTLGAHAMGTVATLYDATGVRHDFRISTINSVTDTNPSGPGPAGDLLWARTIGGAGGALHAGYWRMGGSGPAGGIVDFSVAINSTSGMIEVVAVFGPPNGGPEGGLELQTSWDPNVGGKPALNWYQPSNAGPWRVPIRRGEVLPAEMLVNAPKATTPTG